MSNDLFRLAEFLPYQLSIASNAVSDRISQVYRERYDLRVAEWRVMAVLGDAGALTQRELAARTLMDKVAVNRACKALAARGLAKRLPNHGDGRSHLLELSDAGRRMHREIVPLAREMEREIFAAFGPAEQQAFADLLGRLRERALAGQGG